MSLEEARNAFLSATKGEDGSSYVCNIDTDDGTFRIEGERFEDIFLVRPLKTNILRSTVWLLCPVALDFVLEMTTGVLA